jgi:hypothetical protein
LAIALMLWLRRRITGKQTVHFCLARAAAEGVTTKSARRAVRHLEAAGLVRVVRRPGRGLEVTILET